MSVMLSKSVANESWLEMGNKNGKKVADVGRVHYTVSLLWVGSLFESAALGLAMHIFQMIFKNIHWAVLTITYFTLDHA